MSTYEHARGRSAAGARAEPPPEPPPGAPTGASPGAPAGAPAEPPAGAPAGTPPGSSAHLNGLAALADPTRRTIFERLAEQPQAVGELARELPVSRPAVSQHLKVLKEAGLVVDRRVGNRGIYQVDPRGLEAMRAYLDQFWKRALTAFKAAAERPAQEEQ